jgi:hypothetical protein
MPTGYTAAIKDGISFEKFVWNCARAFGALVTMRDDPMDAPIPQAFEASPYYAEALAKAQAELARLKAMTTREISAACEADYQAAVKRRSERIAEAAELRRKYLVMHAKVQAWTPPTPDHESMKKFMAEQIETSIDHDCDISYYKGEPKKQSPEAWHAAEVIRAEHDIEYYEREFANEQERIDSRNAWLKALRESVPPAP